jgi:hypothetical protein
MDTRPPAALGPRLAGRLTAELIGRSPQYMNCVQLYEIDLRGELGGEGVGGAAHGGRRSVVRRALMCAAEQRRL